MRRAPLPRALTALLVAAALAGAWSPAPPVAAQTDQRCFPETGVCIAGSFRAYWEQHGGLPVFGYPIEPARPEPTRDTAGEVRLTQWFERNRFELHGDAVLLGRLGDDRLFQLGVDWRARPKATPQDGCDYFQETGRNVCDQGAGLGFKSYWTARGGLAFFGFPLTEAAEQTNRAGDRVLTQWFERARFEWHAGNPDESKVLLGLLGTEMRIAPPRPVAPPWDPADPAVAPLVGTYWEVVALGAGDAPPARRPTLIFRSDGVVEGNAGCNGYGGDSRERSYYLGLPGGGLRIRHGPVQAAACGPDGVMEYEGRFLDALIATAAYRLEGERLTLLDGSGQPLLTLAAFSPDCAPTLVSPAPGATLDNGRSDRPETREWEFRWSACPAAAAYRLYVIGPTATVPLIDEVTGDTAYRFVTQTSYTPDRARRGWTWRVRARFNEQWGPWSETRSFDVEPVNTDPPPSGGR
jgi:heat shock protein HslJ